MILGKMLNLQTPMQLICLSVNQFICQSIKYANHLNEIIASKLIHLTNLLILFHYFILISVNLLLM